MFASRSPGQVIPCGFPCTHGTFHGTIHIRGAFKNAFLGGSLSSLPKQHLRFPGWRYKGVKTLRSWHFPCRKGIQRFYFPAAWLRARNGFVRFGLITGLGCPEPCLGLRIHPLLPNRRLCSPHQLSAALVLFITAWQRGSWGQCWVTISCSLPSSSFLLWRVQQGWISGWGGVVTLNLCCPAQGTRLLSPSSPQSKK